MLTSVLLRKVYQLMKRVASISPQYSYDYLFILHVNKWLPHLDRDIKKKREIK